MVYKIHHNSCGFFSSFYYGCTWFITRVINFEAIFWAKTISDVIPTFFYILTNVNLIFIWTLWSHTFSHGKEE